MPSVKMLTYTNRTIDLHNLSEDDIDMQDIAHALAMQVRYNGHCSKFYSVAEHSVMLAEHALEVSGSVKLAQCMLLHDATEAYVGDMISALKETMPEFRELEDNIAKVIASKYGYLREWIAFQPPIHEFDKRICVDEMEQLFVEPPAFEQYPLDLQTQCWSPERAKKEFLKTAVKLNLIKGEEVWYKRLFYSMVRRVREKTLWLTIRFHITRNLKLSSSPLL